MNQNSLAQTFDKVDEADVGWMTVHDIELLRVSLGIVFFWFGFLKFFPESSPAEDLAMRTIQVLTFGMIPNSVAIIVLACWECLIGLGLLANSL